MHVAIAAWTVTRPLVGATSYQYNLAYLSRDGADGEATSKSVQFRPIAFMTTMAERLKASGRAA